MKRIFTHWFLIGETLSTYPTMADGFGDAASKFGANVKGITAPGYSVVKDELALLKFSLDWLNMTLNYWSDGQMDGMAGWPI